MQTHMNALVSYAPNDYRYEPAAIPAIGPGEILLRVHACGICAGDIKALHGGMRIWGTSPDNRYIEPPVISGHEFYGEIVDMASDVTGYALGDLLALEQIVPCGHCPFCIQGRYWLCVDSAVFGFKQHCHGGFAEYVRLPKNSIKHKLPANFTPEQAVMVEPIACGMHAVERAGITHDDVVVIAGLGAIGVSMVNLARLMLPKMIIGIDIRPHRLALGCEYGADHVIDAQLEDAAQVVRSLTGGLGCDVYIEASGSPASVTQGLECLINQGRFVQMGVFAQEVLADWNIIGDSKALTIIGSHLSALTYPSVISGIASGLIQTRGLISHAYALADWEKAFSTAQHDPAAMKVMLTP